MPLDQPGQVDDRDARLHYRTVRTPSAASVLIHRQALELLRPGLATVWLEAVPGSAAWPVELAAAATELELRAATRREQPVTARRVGTGPETMILDPGADDDFALLLALAPHSAAVEGMSRRGQLVISRRRDDQGLRLRLTTEEHTALVSAVPEAAAWLVRADRPGGQNEANSRGRRLVGWAAATGVAVLVFLGAGLELWHRPEWFGGASAWAIGAVLVMGQGSGALSCAARRWWRERGIPA